MTDDIVARLRGYCDGNNDLMDAAADDIERLRVTMDVVLADRRAALSENHDLWREIERLRAALREAREDILLRHNARGSEALGTDEEVVSFIDAALAGEKTDG